LIAAQVEACHAAFVKTVGGAQAAAVGAAGGYTTDGNRYQEIRPGGIHYLNPEEEISFGSPSRPGATFAPFMEWNGRNIAAAMNFPYEMLCKNWGGLSFAAGRLVLAEARQFTKSQQKLLNEAWLSPIWARMVEEAVITGAVDIPPRLYQRMPWAFHAHQWGPPAWPFALTPREEIEARLAAIEGNLDTKQNAISELGGWWREVFKQRAIEREQERELQIQPGGAKAEADAEARKMLEPQDGEEELAQEAAV
jgi:capsid protein